MTEPLIGSAPIDSTEIAAYRFVKTPAAAVVTAAATDMPFGSSQETLAASATAKPVLIAGKGKITASAAIAKYAFIMCGAAGKAATHTGTNTRCGIALEAATGDGHIIDYLHLPPTLIGA